MDRPFFIVVRCVVVVTQDEADFRFVLSPEGAQAQWTEGGRPTPGRGGAEEGGRGRRGRNKNFCAPRPFKTELADKRSFY